MRAPTKYMGRDVKFQGTTPSVHVQGGVLRLGLLDGSEHFDEGVWHVISTGSFYAYVGKKSEVEAYYQPFSYMNKNGNKEICSVWYHYPTERTYEEETSRLVIFITA